MAPRAEFFLASSADVAEGIAAQGPSAAMPSHAFGGIEDVMLTTLNGIATGRDLEIETGGFEALFDEVEEVDAAGDEGPWVFRVPALLLDALAEADEPRRRAINEEWAATEEIAADPGRTWPVVEALTSLARAAHRDGGAVLFRLSL